MAEAIFLLKQQKRSFDASSRLKALKVLLEPGKTRIIRSFVERRPNGSGSCVRKVVDGYIGLTARGYTRFLSRMVQSNNRSRRPRLLLRASIMTLVSSKCCGARTACLSR